MNTRGINIRPGCVCFIAALLLSLSLSAFPSIVSGADYYVKTPANGGNDSNSGLDWNNAKATIGSAMGLVSGASNIHVAAGTYNEKVIFPGYDNVALLGGYAAAGGGSQDPAANGTIIDGAGQSTSIAMVYVPIKPGGTAGYFGIVIDGFTIRNGTRANSGVAGIESYSLGVTITRNIIENNQVTGTGGTAGGIYVFGPFDDNDNGRTIIERNIVRNNSSAAVGGIYLEGASGKAKRYIAYLVNNLIYGNQSTNTDAGWNRGVGGIDIMYPASASIVNCTIVDNTAAHPDPDKAVGGISISGFTNQNGIAAIANSIIGGDSGKDILVAPDGTGTLWIAYSSVKDTGISGTGVIHTPPQFVGGTDYHLTESSPCRNAGSTAGTVLTGSVVGPGLVYLPDVAWKSVGYTDAQVTLSWGDGVHNMSSQWRYDSALSTSYGYPVGRFFGTANASCTVGSSCTADPSYRQVVSNMATVNASGYSFYTDNSVGEVNPFGSKQTIFYRGTNGYYGAWYLNSMSYTTHGSSKDGRLTGAWYFQTNGSPYFDAGIRTVDLDGKTRPNQTGYDMGAYEYYDLCATNLVNISGTSNYYTALQTAYIAAEDGQTLLAQAVTFTETLTFGDNIAVSLKGGYDCGFASVTGSTTVAGNLTLKGGTVTIDNIKIK